MNLARYNAPGRLEDAGALISATMLASKNIGIANAYFKKVLDYNELRKDKLSLIHIFRMEQL